MITFQHEPVMPFLSENMDVLRKHYEEIAERTDVIELNPNIPLYEELYSNGKLEVHVARDDGKCIGYHLWIVSLHLHYKKSLTAHSDVLFILPEYRKGMFGAKFIKWSLEEIKKRKPQRILFHVKPSLNYGPILERMGAHIFETAYSIILE